MKRNLLLSAVALTFVGLAGFAWACPGGHFNDNGVCDTLRLEVYPPDTIFSGPGQLVRVTLHFTSDSPAGESLAAFLVPLCYTHTNPDKYCSLSAYWNTNRRAATEMERSVFRNFNGEYNVILTEWLSHSCGLWYWWELNLDGISYFGLPLGYDEMCYFLVGPTNNGLLATMTFKLEDTMTICIDSCNLSRPSQLRFVNSLGNSYIPRDNMPYCFSVRAPTLGDVNSDGVIDVGDVIYVINYLYRNGPAPNPSTIGDVNCDGVVEVGDVVYLINYLYRGGPSPGC